MAKVLLIEDDEVLAPLVVRHLADSGFDVTWAPHAAAAAERLAEPDLDLVVLDVMLPGEDGLSLCRRIRRAGNTAIIMVTAGARNPTGSWIATRCRRLSGQAI